MDDLRRFSAVAPKDWDKTDNYYGGFVPRVVDVAKSRESFEGKLTKWFGYDPKRPEMANPILKRVGQVYGSLLREISGRQRVTFCYDPTCPKNAGAHVNKAMIPLIRLGEQKDKVFLCDGFFKMGEGERAKVLVHEMTHLYADTKDHGYVDAIGPNDKPVDYWTMTVLFKESDPFQLSSKKALENADTYAGFLGHAYGL